MNGEEQEKKHYASDVVDASLAFFLTFLDKTSLDVINLRAKNTLSSPRKEEQIHASNQRRLHKHTHTLRQTIYIYEPPQKSHVSVALRAALHPELDASPSIRPFTKQQQQIDDQTHSKTKHFDDHRGKHAEEREEERCEQQKEERFGFKRVRGDGFVAANEIRNASEFGPERTSDAKMVVGE